jgi:hypothetical protein
MVRCASELTDTMHELFSYVMPTLLQRGDDCLRESLLLVELYVMANASATMQAHASILLPAFTAIIQGTACPPINLVLKVCW